MSIKSTLLLLFLAVFTVLAGPELVDCDGPPPNPRSAKIRIEQADPDFVSVYVKAPASTWFELRVTEDFAQWYTVAYAFGDGHEREFQFPTYPFYSPFLGEIGASGHLFFSVRLHKKCEPVPPL